jgi:general stress protein CsbA
LILYVDAFLSKLANLMSSLFLFEMTTLFMIPIFTSTLSIYIIEMVLDQIGASFESAQLTEEYKAQLDVYSIVKGGLIMTALTGNIYTIYNIVIDLLSRYDF